MVKHNKWVHGLREFVLAPLPPEHVGRPGPLLMAMTFDPDVGEEVFLLIKEEAGFAEAYQEVSPLTLLATTGLLRTPFGIAPYIVWTVGAQSPADSQFEHFLDPAEDKTLGLLVEAAKQTHLKMVIVNCVTSAVTAFVDYENVFGLGDLAEAISSVVEIGPDYAFDRAVSHVKADVPLDVLLGKSAA